MKRTLQVLFDQATARQVRTAVWAHSANRMHLTSAVTEEHNVTIEKLPAKDTFLLNLVRPGGAVPGVLEK